MLLLTVFGSLSSQFCSDGQVAIGLLDIFEETLSTLSSSHTIINEFVKECKDLLNHQTLVKAIIDNDNIDLLSKKNGISLINRVKHVVYKDQESINGLYKVDSDKLITRLGVLHSDSQTSLFCENESHFYRDLIDVMASNSDISILGVTLARSCLNTFYNNRNRVFELLVKLFHTQLSYFDVLSLLKDLGFDFQLKNDYNVNSLEYVARYIVLLEDPSLIRLDELCEALLQFEIDFRPFVSVFEEFDKLNLVSILLPSACQICLDKLERNAVVDNCCGKSHINCIRQCTICPNCRNTL